MKKYIYISFLTFIFAIIVAFLPKQNTKKELSPEEFLSKINSPSYFINSDELAKSIIEKDPNIFLIDLREKEEFDKFSLSNAVNIPLKDLLKIDNLDYLEQENKKIIFYSNGTTYSNQAWTIATRLNYKNLYVLKGGLNNWKKTILEPEYPKENADFKEFDLYEFRMGASQYFTGGGKKEGEKAKSKKKKVIKKRKKKEVEGGC